MVTGGLNVKIINHNRILFQGLANSVTSVNEIGIFDVLPIHANFITLVREYIIVDRGAANEQKFDVERGVLRVQSNNVEVYLGL